MTTPIRLVFCITELDSGGAERALTQLVTNLNRDQWEPYVICLGPRGHFADILEQAQIPVVCLNARGLFSLPGVVWQLARQLARLRPSLVQTFLFHANIVGRIASRMARVPCVVSGIRVAEHRSRWYGRVDRWTNFLVTTNVCVSQGVADFSSRVTGLDANKLVVIPNSVDFDRFALAQPADLTVFGIPLNSRVFIAIGRLERQKGIDVLLDAVRMLFAGSQFESNTFGSIPADVHFLIVGDGPDANELRETSSRYQIADRIHFVGRRDDIPELLAASKALVLPSRWEGMPNVVLEAMAAALPVIATRVEGIAELVRDGVTGTTVPPEQPQELAKAIQNFLLDTQFLRRAGNASQEIVKKDFAINSVVDAYTNLYRRLLNHG
jgi:starch synthase (maltosyl-transferring)